MKLVILIFSLSALFGVAIGFYCYSCSKIITKNNMRVCDPNETWMHHINCDDPDGGVPDEFCYTQFIQDKTTVFSRHCAEPHLFKTLSKITEGCHDVPLNATVQSKTCFCKGNLCNNGSTYA